MTETDRSNGKTNGTSHARKLDSNTQAMLDRHAARLAVADEIDGVLTSAVEGLLQDYPAYEEVVVEKLDGQQQRLRRAREERRRKERSE